MGRFIRRENNGKIYLRENQTNEWILVSNQSTVETKVQKRNKQKISQSSLFKLITVRNLKGLPVETITSRLRAAQTNLEKSAVLSGKKIVAPVVFPSSATDTVNYFSVFVDEDLYGYNEPVYTFYSRTNQNQIRAYISANSEKKGGWSVHLAYVEDAISKESGLKEIVWTLVTLDNADIAPTNDQNNITNSLTTYKFSSKDLPYCFRYNFSLDSLVYLGGGGWSALAVEDEDKIPIYGRADPSDTRYKRVGNSRGANYTIVSYSYTPTYSFSWCRGVLKLNRRTRNASVTSEAQTLIDTGVIVSNRLSNYSLDLTLRPNLSSTTLKEFGRKEYCNSTASYVGNTNYLLSSPRQSPDYGTDSARFSLQNYYQQSNVIRPNPYCVLSASKNMDKLLTIDLGVAEGSIKHPYDIKSTIGERGVSYDYQYKYWWSYGKIIDAYPLTKNQYTYYINRATGQQAPSTLFVDGTAPYGQFYKTLPNQTITTWDAPLFPTSGYFPVRRGTFQFVLRYSMPPVFSHDGVYYYEKNPIRIGANSSSADRYYDATVSQPTTSQGLAPSFTSQNDFSGNNNQNTFIAIYTQLLGALDGASVSSYNIGYRPIAATDIESIVVLSPNPSQKVELDAEPSLFPNAFTIDGKENIVIDN